MRVLICLVAILLASPAPAQWSEARSDHFVILSADEPEAVRTLAGQLERFDAALRLLFNVPRTRTDKAGRVTVYVLADMAEMRRLSGRADIGGFYIPRAGGSVAFVPRRGSGRANELNGLAVLLHEYAHHFMYSNFPGAYPPWFSEGFAEFAGQTRFEDDGAVTVGGTPLYRIGGLGSPLLPIPEMLTRDMQRLPPDMLDPLYARGWLLTHYLTFSEKRRGQLSSYLAAIARGTPAPQAARDSFGDLQKLQIETNGYSRGRQIPGVRIGANALPTGTITVRALSAAESAMMPIVLVSQRGVDEARGKRLLPEARRVAMRYPTDAFVQGALAEAAFDARALDEAEAAADRTLAADPASMQGLVYKGRIRLARAKQASDSGEATWREARSWLIKASRVDADNAVPLMLFYQSFGDAKAAPSANAVLAVERALRLSPEDRTLRMMVGRSQLERGKLAEARATIAPIVFAAHGGSASRWMVDIADALGAGDRDKAIKLWDAGPPKQEGEASKRGSEAQLKDPVRATRIASAARRP